MSVTCNCETGNHERCGGYVAPLVFANDRPCECSCHLGSSPRVPILVGESIDEYNARVADGRARVAAAPLAGFHWRTVAA